MSELASETAALQRWLFDDALALWWTVGADRERGGFHDAIELTGVPSARPRRARSITRMVFSYAEAGRLGWGGPWREAAGHALAYLRKHFVTADATVASIVDVDGHTREAPFDLYDQAFALLAFASAERVFGETSGGRASAVALRTTLERHYAHPLGGFFEDRDQRLPQRSNPHMHVLEAALAWLALDTAPGWRQLADGIAALARDKFIDPASGALREFFDAEWRPAAGLDGRVCEPGHQYEWAFLLARWAALTGRPRPAVVERLIAFADRHGLDTERGVAIGSVLSDGTRHDPVARLWAQAERIRAYRIERRPGDDVARAIRGLRRFLATPKAGLWFDQLTRDNRLIPEPARATSLYHIVGAVAELSRCGSESARR